jgi:hypothetical protein
MVTLHPGDFVFDFSAGFFWSGRNAKSHAVTISIMAARVNAMEDVIVSERLPTVSQTPGFGLPMASERCVP